MFPSQHLRHSRAVRTAIDPGADAGWIESGTGKREKRGPSKISPNDPKVKMAKKLSKNFSISIGEICNTLKISRATYYRFLKNWE